MHADLEYHLVPVNGIRLHVVQAGPTEGQPLVLLHGFPEFWYGWRKQIPVLAQAGFRVIVPDQRGYNRSDVPTRIDDYRLDCLTADILALLDALGHPACYLAGHDWGAMVAWSLALAHPDRIHRLAILNVPHPLVMAEYLKKNPRQILKSWYFAFFQIAAIPEWLLSRNHYDRMAAALRASGQENTFSSAEIDQYRIAWQHSGLRGMINWYRALARHRPTPPADPRLRQPVHILWGKRDIALRHEMAQASVAWCDNAALTFYDQATHWVQHDAAEQVNTELITFFSK